MNPLWCVKARLIHFFDAACVCMDCSMGTVNKINCCSQQTEDWGWGDDFQMFTKKTFGLFGKCYKKTEPVGRGGSCATDVNKYVLAPGQLE